MLENYQQLINLMGYNSMPAGFLTLIFLISIWALVWKGIALWKAAQNGSKPWFIAILIINTAGILEIIYIFFFSKKKDK